MTSAQVLRRLAALPTHWLSHEERQACADGAAALDERDRSRRSEDDTRPLAPPPTGTEPR